MPGMLFIIELQVQPWEVDFWMIYTIWREYISHDFSGSLFQTFCPNILIVHMNLGSHPDLQLGNGLGTISLSVLWDGRRPKWRCVKFLSSRHFLIQSQSSRWSDPSKHQVWHACRDKDFIMFNVCSTLLLPDKPLPIGVVKHCHIHDRLSQHKAIVRLGWINVYRAATKPA